MTPKEKALELWWKFYNRIEHTLSEEYSPHENFISRQLALIAVEELIYETQFEVPNIRQRYWIDVKQEIEKL
jgi:hypothetical protein